MLVFCIHVKFFIKAAEECTKQGEAQLEDRKEAPSVAAPDKVGRKFYQDVLTLFFERLEML